jgi:KaiC/GvpD/RAD55 family RecA-like ATPase
MNRGPDLLQPTGRGAKTIRSSIAPLDLRIGGLVEGRQHLLTGGPGAGKTTACLHFLSAGLRNGESVALLTLDRLDDLDSHARYLGLELEPAIREERLLLLRFRTDFTSLLWHAGLPDRVTADLGRMLARVQPSRIAIDPLTPFLADGAATAGLAVLLDGLEATSLVTYPADVSGGYDTRLDPVVQRAAVILHLERRRVGGYRIRVTQNRTAPTPPTALEFALKAGEGFVAPARRGPAAAVLKS